MSRIRIKNFGPINKGLLENDGWIDIKKTTVFIGNQGSGKSTVAKVISTLSWIEKSLVRGDQKESYFKIYNRFKKQFAYQNIINYFRDDTEIEYEGDVYNILYINNRVDIIEKEKGTLANYLFPKIMYVPAERNFISAVDNPITLKRLPNTLYTFLDEFLKAGQATKETIELPINNARFEYEKRNKISYLTGDNYKIKLSEASSGFQSVVPLFLVTDYLVNYIKKDDDSLSEKDNNLEGYYKIRNQVNKILSDKKLSSDIKKAALEYLSAKSKYACFINIVEEPELNLFPSSQFEILKMLLKYNNELEGNKLILTTHSPYIISFLGLSIQGGYLYDKLKDSKNDILLERMERVIPVKSLISSANLVIYELDEKEGNIKILSGYNGIPSDDNMLNNMLVKGNELFDSLLEIEQEL